MYPFLVTFILVLVVSTCKGQRERDSDVSPKDPYIEAGSSIKIVCHTRVHGRIYWKLNNKVIDESLSDTINTTHTVLTLRNFTEHSAALQCHSKTTGEILGGTIIKTYTKPSNISCILDYDTQEAIGVPDVLICNWDHWINPSKEINYTVLSASSYHPSQKEICSSRGTTCTCRYKMKSDEIIRLLGSFNVTVRAKSADFEAYSETQEFTSSHIWKVVRPKLDVTTCPGGLMVNWTQMDSVTGVPCHCQVRYSKAINGKTPEWVINKTLDCEEKGKIIIDKVESCTTYKFSVRCAIDEAPWSDWSLEKKVLTKLNMTDVKLHLWRKIAEPDKNGFRKVHAMWTGIPSTCRDRLIYMMKLIPLKHNIPGLNYTEFTCGRSTCDVDVNQDAHRILLKVSQNDTLSVVDSVYVPAAEESLPQVTDIQTSTLEGVIQVTWKAPAQPVSGYMIDYTHEGNQYYWKESKYTNVTLKDLADKKPYNITVTPLSDGKAGHGTQALQVCSRVGDPGNVTINNVQAYDKSAFVSWDVKTQEVCSGVVVRYTVFYSAQKGPYLNATVDSTRQFISLKDLTPDTQYHVYVQATALTSTTQSSERLFTTKRFDPRLVTALLVCGSITMVLVLCLGLCCAIQWKKFKEKPVPNPGLSSVAVWSSENHQERTCSVQPFNTPHESHCDRVYPEELGRTSTPPLVTGCTSYPCRDQMEEYTVPDVVPVPDLKNKDLDDSEETLHPSSSGESTALLLSENNQFSPYRSQSSQEAPAQRISKQSKCSAGKQQENTTLATIYVTLDMFDNGKVQLREMETKP
ncbi:interleukin-31 receptor subunit alpha-like [Cheilinus undulatus]|uniref:interleukin-31 receptor subunit alpha-like n=1 Tax=Cheilinus undulatus TaxID=241271 RepID=UPI001BD2A5BF|nr:interleukin-31 receptor subunit alpha-like [Cheilinus undulatus]